MVDYSLRPSAPHSVLADVTNTLAAWLPSAEGAAPLETWDHAAWRCAEWVVYWQNALPWLVERIRASGVCVPADVEESLLLVCAHSRERTRRMLDAAAELLARLSVRAIRAIPLKGAVLAPLYYPDPLTRPMADLDILIHPDDVPAGIEVLRQLGYRYFSRSAEDEVYLRGNRKEDVWDPDNVQPVELHYALREEFAGLAYDLADDMWRSSEMAEYWGGERALLARRPALLHHVCAHATSDLFIKHGRLMHIDDLRKISGAMTTRDWEEFDRQVKPCGARFVYPALALHGKYADLGVPHGLLARLRDDCPGELLAWAENTGLAEASDSNSTARDGNGFALARMLARSPGERASMLLRSTFPRRRNLTKRYPRLTASPLWPAGYLLINADRLWQLAKLRLLHLRP